jgi:hypothetical protein
MFIDNTLVSISYENKQIPVINISIPEILSAYNLFGAILFKV